MYSFGKAGKSKTNLKTNTTYKVKYSYQYFLIYLVIEEMLSEMLFNEKCHIIAVYVTKRAT